MDLNENVINNDVYKVELQLRACQVVWRSELASFVCSRALAWCSWTQREGRRVLTSSFSHRWLVVWQTCFLSPNEQIPSSFTITKQLSATQTPFPISFKGGTLQSLTGDGNSFIYNPSVSWFLTLQPHNCGHLRKLGQTFAGVVEWEI